MKPVPDRIRNGLFAALLSVLAGMGSSAGSQVVSANPQVLGLEPSARSAAMGHTGTAVFWGAFPEFYWNPALLGHHRGIRYEWSSTQIAPDLTDDLFFRANRLTLGEWGLGITLSGDPIHNAGGTYFDMGENQLTDYSGQVIGTFDSYEELNTWGFGVNGVELAEHLFRRGIADGHPLSRFGDVSFGYASKDVEVFLFPETTFFPAAQDRITTHDLGYLIRLTPYDSIDHAGLWPSFDRTIAPFASGFRADLSYGHSKLNDEGETIDPGFDENPDPVPRIENQGYGVRVAFGLPSATKAELEAGNASWLASALSPMLSLGFAWDQQQLTYRSGDERLEGPEYHSHGVEVTFCDVFSIRSGEYDTGDGGTNSTWGYGLGFHVPGLGGAYFDRGQVSLGSFGNDEPTAVGFWVDPVGFVRWVRSDGTPTQP